MCMKENDLSFHRMPTLIWRDNESLEAHLLKLQQVKFQVMPGHELMQLLQITNLLKNEDK